MAVATKHPVATAWESMLAEDPEAVAEFSATSEGRALLNKVRANFIKQQTGGDRAQIRQVLTDIGAAREVRAGETAPEARRGSFFGAFGRGFQENLTGSALRLGAQMAGAAPAPLEAPDDVAIASDTGSFAGEVLGGIAGNLFDPLGFAIGGGAGKLAAPLGRAAVTAAGRALPRLRAPGQLAAAGRAAIAAAPGGAIGGAVAGAALPLTQMAAGDRVTGMDVLRGGAYGAGVGLLAGPGPGKPRRRTTPEVVTPEVIGPERQLPAPGETVQRPWETATVPEPPPPQPGAADMALLRQQAVITGKELARLQEKRGYGRQPLTAAELEQIDGLTARQESNLRALQGLPTLEELQAPARLAQPSPYSTSTRPLRPGALELTGIAPATPLRPGALAPPAPLHPQLRVDEPGAGMVPGRPLWDLDTPVPVPAEPPSALGSSFMQHWPQEGFPAMAPGEIPGIPPEPPFPGVDWLPPPRITARAPQLPSAADPLLPPGYPPLQAPRGGLTLSNNALQGLKDYAKAVSLPPREAVRLLATETDELMRSYGLDQNDANTVRALAERIEPPRPTSGIAEPPTIPAARGKEVSGAPEERLVAEGGQLQHQGAEGVRPPAETGGGHRAIPGAQIEGKPLGQYETGELARPPENLGELTKQRLRGMRTVETGGETGGTTRRLTTEPPPAPPPRRRSRPVRVEPAAAGAMPEGAVKAEMAPETKAAKQVAGAFTNVPAAPKVSLPTSERGTAKQIRETAGRDFENQLQRVSDDQEIRAAVFEYLKADEPAIVKARGGRRVPHQVTQARAAKLGIDDVLDPSKIPWLQLPEHMERLKNTLEASSNTVVTAARKHLAGETDYADLLRAMAVHQRVTYHAAGAEAGTGRAMNILQATKSARGQAKALADVADLIEQMGGQARGKKFAEMVLRVAADKDALRAAQFARRSLGAKTWDVITEYWINSILSGPPTHVANLVSNSLVPFAKVAETAGAAALGTAREALTGQRGTRTYFSEIPAQLRGIWEGLGEGWALAGKAFLEEESSWGVLAAGGKLEGYPKAITGEGTAVLAKRLGASPRTAARAGKAVGILGRIVRAPGNALLAEDEIFKSIAFRQTIRGLATRAGRNKGLTGAELAGYVDRAVANPPDKLIEAGHRAGFYQTFNQGLNEGGGMLRSLGQHSLAFRRAHPVATFVIPFVRTPINIVKYAQERSPLAALDPQFAADMRAGGQKRDLALSKMLMGTAGAAAIFGAFTQGNITGGGPSDPKDKATWRAAGNQPYSVKIGTKWIQYNRFAPFGVIAGMAADAASMYQAGREGVDPIKVGGMLIRAVSHNIGEQTMVAGLTTLANAMADPDRYSRTFLEQIFGAAVPSLAAKGAAALDPTVRDVADLHERLLSRIPGASERLPARQTPLGDPITREGGLTTFLFPGTVQEVAKADPVYQELYRLRLNLARPGASIEEGGREYPLSREQRSELERRAGQRAKEQIGRVIASAGWERQDSERQRDVIQTIVRRARALERSRLLPELRRAAK